MRCCRCRVRPVRAPGQGYCHQCHAEYMRDWRLRNRRSLLRDQIRVLEQGLEESKLQVRYLEVALGEAAEVAT